MAQKKKKRSKKPRSGRVRRLLLRTVTIVVALPFVLMFLYIVPFVHPVSTMMLRDVLVLRGYERQWVNFDDIAPALVQSVLMSEDGRYCLHDGVDWGALNLVIDEALEGERSRGASTIPMQAVKNLFLWSSRSYIRKVLEVPLAIAADTIWSKKRLMEIYLNVAEWAPGVYGIEAASQYYYGIPAAKLSRRRAAYLAVTLPNPYLRNPVRPSKGLVRLARIVERRAHQSGAYIKCLYE
ncbi:MAG: monofunctional biosynthetic peptidoglycan transglycosylase [Hyphomicrobiales bacterium]|nr:monofunctional biosynthetic peptidoglycan transglycosylase [Hyphomicrobiales bacterium]MCP5001566.1 monofunctional biosynthetic peptidoglycan transglycosylase [Hyphomicrobiales bacterium]